MSDTLTPEKLDQMILKAKAMKQRQQPSIRHVVASSYWPKEFSHMERQRWAAHPIILWLAKWLPIDPYVVSEHPRYNEREPMLNTETGVLYCSQAQEAALRRELAPNKDPRVHSGWQSSWGGVGIHSA